MPIYNSVFRAFRYLATDAPLVGKTLTKKATITGKTPSYYKPDDLVAGVDNLNEIPTANTLQQNYPNPFNPETVITWQIKSPGNVSLKVYDIMGREVATLVNEYKSR